MIKRRSNMTFCFFLHLIGTILLFTAIFLPAGSWLWRLFHLFYLLSAICYIAASRCPHCGRLGLHVKPFGKNAGYCRRCGELVEFDD